MSHPIPEELQIADQPRRFRLYPFQWVGIPLIMLVPLIAIFGLFGETFTEVRTSGADLDLRVAYADRYRYKQINTFEIHVTNRTGSGLDTVLVRVDRAFVRRFSTIVTIPTPTIPFEFELTNVRPGEERLVWMEMQGEQYGRHEGSVTAVVAGDTDSVQVQLATTIYP